MDRIKSTLKSDWGILILDIIAVNLAYFLALMIRVSISDIGGIFNTRGGVSVYYDAFYRFAPWYTLICIVVFMLFRLYGGVWRLAGVNDLHRILGASLVTCVLQVLGSWLFVRRMPVTYYVIGAFLQLLFITGIRFGHRVIAAERRYFAKKSGVALIVGAGDLGRQAAQVIKNDEDFRVDCFVDTENEHVGRLLDGVPVFHPDELRNILENHQITCVFLAEPHLSAPDRRNISKTCNELGVELRESRIDSEKVTTAPNKSGAQMQFTTISYSDDYSLSQEEAWLQSVLSGSPDKTEKK